MPIFPGRPVDPKNQTTAPIEDTKEDDSNFLDLIFPGLKAIGDADAKKGIDPRQDNSLNPLKIGLGMGETAAQVVTGFAGAVPATAAGVFESVKEGTIQAFPEAFLELQEALTFQPRTSKGKKYSGVLGEIFELPDELVEEKLVEPNIEQGNPGLATVGKVSAEALKMLAPIRILGGGRGTKPKPKVESFEGSLESLVKPSTKKLFPEEPIEGVKAPEILKTEEVQGPLTEVESLVKIADQKIAESTGQLEIVRPVKEKLLNPIDFVKSPRKVATKFPEFQSTKKLADEAGQTTRQLQNIFGKRVRVIDEALGGKIAARVKDFGKSYRSNKAELHKILLTEDMAGRDFTSLELKTQGFNAEIIKAHTKVRPAFNHALSLINRTREARGKDPINKRTGYVPHYFHTWVVRDIEGSILGSARSVKEASKIAQEAVRQGRDVTIEPKQFEFANEGLQQITLADVDYFRFQNRLKKEFSLTAGQAIDITQNLAKRVGRSRFFGPALERKGAPNFEKDLDFAFRHYFNQTARYVALDRFKQKSFNDFQRKYGDFEAEQKSNTIAKYTKNYINDVLGVPREIEAVLDNMFKGEGKFAKFMSDRLGSRPASQMAAFTTKAVAAAKLGFLNVSAAMVNGSQLMMGNAILGPKWMGNGIRRAAKLDVKKIGKGLGIKQKNPDLAILEKLGVEFQEGLEGAHNLSGKIGKMFDAGLLPFTMVEYRLRASVSLGAYHKAFTGEVKGIPAGNKVTAMEFARHTNTRANFDYTVADAPAFIRRWGSLSQVAFQFKKFPIKALEFMSELKGAEAARFWIPFLTISGMYGFPGSEALNRAVRSIYGIDMELETKDFWFRWAGEDPGRRAIANTIMRGILSNKELGGVDLSRRIGGGDFIPTRPSDLAGPAASSLWRAGQMAAQGEWVKAMRQMITTPGNIALAIQNDGEIYNVWVRNRLQIKLTPEEQIKKGFGLTSTRQSNERDVVRIIRNNERTAREAQEDAIDNFIRFMKKEEPKSEKERQVVVQGIVDANVTASQIEREFGNKGLKPSLRAWLNLGPLDMAKNQKLLDFLREEDPDDVEEPAEKLPDGVFPGRPRDKTKSLTNKEFKDLISPKP